MLSVVIIDTNTSELYGALKKMTFMYPKGISFYNTLTSRVELTTKPYKGIYPPSILLYGNFLSYRSSILHYKFSNLNFTSPILRDYQKPVFREFMVHYNECISKGYPTSVNIQAPCGFGKSETTLKIILSLKVKSIIIVKTKILVNHWCGYLQTYGINHLGSFDGATELMKTFNEGSVQIPDVLVIVSRHVENYDFVTFLQSNYSLCLVDEIHSWCLSTDSELSKFVITQSFPVNIYLTATPNMLDYPVYGKIIKAEHPPSFYNMRRFYMTYSRIDKDVVIVDDSKDNEPLDAIQSDQIRNQIIITCMLENLDTCSIVYCNRRRHVDLLFNGILNSLSKLDLVNNLTSDDVLISFQIRKKEFRILKGDAEHTDIHLKIKDLSKYENFILISTVQFCACGLDLPSVKVVMLALSSIDNNTLKQAVGRAERGPYEGQRIVYVFTSTQPTINSMCASKLKNKKSLFMAHPQSSYTQLYNKFIKDCQNIQNTLKNIGWEICKH